MPVSRARAAAFDILIRVEREDSYASELLHSAVYKRLSAPDHALATEIVMGVLRWRSRLDDEIAIASAQPLTKLDVEVLVALRLALYQFLWLDRIPRRAAIHESVELVKEAHKRSAAPFVNAVLRKLSVASPIHGIPYENADTPAAMARALAHPQRMVERWTEEYGFSATRQICEYNQSVPETAIRLGTTAAEKQLSEEGISLRPGAFLASARRVEAGDITKTRMFREGHVVIQDEASQLVATLVGLGCEAGDESRILDCCAAPGGKTLAIADHNSGAAITAIELHPHRARLLKRRMSAARSGARIHIVAADARRLPLSSSFGHSSLGRPLFDRVLADVPCSGTGTLARNPEIKWRLRPGDLHDLQTRQRAILGSALNQVAPGGRLVYSTCSLEKEENENVIEQSLTENKSFHLLDCRTELEHMKKLGVLTWPDAASLTRGPYLRTIPGVHPCDGFFAAILERI